VSHCIAFTRKGEIPTRYDEDGNWVKLAVVDEELCTHLGVEVHPTRFHANWYDTIGDLLAYGHGYPEIRALYEEHGGESTGLAITIIDFLESTYDVYTWRVSGFAG
jgi:hypothetical protein